MKNILLLFLNDRKISKYNKGNLVASVAYYKDIGDTKTTNESAVTSQKLRKYRRIKFFISFLRKFKVQLKISRKTAKLLRTFNTLPDALPTMLTVKLKTSCNLAILTKRLTFKKQ